MTKKFMPVLLMAAAALAITGCRTAPGPNLRPEYPKQTLNGGY